MVAPDNRDLVAACLWTAATAFVVATSDSALLRGVLGVPTVLFVPGHPLLRAIGIRTSSPLEHLIYAVGASLAAGIAGGFALNLFGLLSPSGWALWFFVVAMAASLVAGRRATPALQLRPRLPQLQPHHVAAFALAASLATGAYALAVRDEAMQQQFKFTEFWMLPSANRSGLTVGVKSGEAQTQRFDLEISVDGRPFAAFRSLAIAPGEIWMREIALPQQIAPQKAEARLYRPEDRQLYRSVSALVPGV